MEAVQKVKQRYSFDLPNDYLRFCILCNVDAPANVTIDFSEVKWWFNADKIAEFEPFIAWQHEFVPFARSYMNDFWSWVVNWETCAGVGVARCIRSSNKADGYAPSFSGALYRMLIEEFAESLMLIGADNRVEAVRRRLARYTDLFQPILEPAWTNVLNELLERPLLGIESNVLSFITANERDMLINRDLSFDWLGKRVTYLAD